MFGKSLTQPRSRRVVGLVLTAALIGSTAAVVFAHTPLSQVWRKWSQSPTSRGGYSASIDVMTERSHVDVYDTRRTPSLIHSFDVAGVESLDAQYTYRPGESSGVFELYSGGPSSKLHRNTDTVSGAADKALVRLNVNASSVVQVDARWQNLYEVETGSRLNLMFGNVVRFERFGFSSKSASLYDSSAVAASSSAAPICIVIRPDMSSPLLRWEKRTAMRGYNGRYYLSAFHPTGVSTSELTAAIKRNPPSD